MKFEKRKTDNPLDARIKINITPTEKKKLQEKAKLANMNMSQYLRTAIKQDKIIVTENIPQLFVEITRIGTNANQILMLAKSSDIQEQDNIKKIEKQLKDIKSIMNKILSTVFEPQSEEKRMEHKLYLMEQKVDKIIELLQDG